MTDLEKYTIKPLEWKWDSLDGSWQAFNMGGSYTIDSTTEGFELIDEADSHYSRLGFFSSEKAAKDSAQVHWENILRNYLKLEDEIS